MSEMNCSRGKRLAIALLLTIVPLSACTYAGEIEATKPEAVGLSAERFERIPAHFQADIDREAVTGFVILVARNGALVLREVMGGFAIAGHRVRSPYGREV